MSLEMDLMDDLSNNEKLLYRYLLGQSDEAEQAAIEERFLSSSEYYAQLLIAEDELLCAYAKGLLPPTDREHFERRFLALPDQRQRVELAKSIMEELSAINSEGKSAHRITGPGQQGWRERLLAMPIFTRPRLAFAITLVALLATAACAWLLFKTSQQRQQIAQLEANQAAHLSQMERNEEEGRLRQESLSSELAQERSDRVLLEQELARQTNPPPSGRDAPTTILSLMLTPGRLRGLGTINRLTIPSAANEVILMLRLGENGKRRSYRVEILNSEGVRIWGREGLRGGRQLVALKVPSRILAEDDYEINLTGLTETGVYTRVGEYYFTVLR